jgi:chemotaxis receptor (MCP) glutamine deamidase CheD
VRASRIIDFGGRRQHEIHIGGIFASGEPAVVRTVLGSCVAVCLRDPRSQIGGMNHFMLPQGGSDDLVSARYGVHAMELLINDCMKLGADRRRFEAKVFGGGHVLQMRESDGNVPQRNIMFALQFLDTENIPIVARDLGGYAAREVLFFTDSGRILLKRLQKTGSDTSRVIVEALDKEERAGLRMVHAAQPAEADANVTLF